MPSSQGRTGRAFSHTSAFTGRSGRLLVRALGDRAAVSVRNPVRLDDGSEPEPDLALLKPRGDESSIRIGGSSYRPSADPRQLSTDFGALCWAASEVEDPFEASFLLLASAAYLQAFEDGNKRMGRLGCNLPLLRAGLPPMSFLAVTPSEYIGGLLAFYELGETAPLADVVSRAYAEAAPHHRTVVTVQVLDGPCGRCRPAFLRSVRP